MLDAKLTHNSNDILQNSSKTQGLSTAACVYLRMACLITFLVPFFVYVYFQHIFQDGIGVSVHLQSPYVVAKKNACTTGI